MAIKKQKNKISHLTINDLAVMMKDGFKTQEKTTNGKINDLAVVMNDGFKKQDGRINDLTVRMNEGFQKQEEMTDDKIENLAGMVKRGFDSVSKEINGVKDDLVIVKEKVGNIENFIFQQQNPRIKDVEKRLYKLEEILMVDR